MTTTTEIIDREFDGIEFAKVLKKWESPYYIYIRDVYKEVREILENRVPVVFPSYTMHNIHHCIRVANYMHEFIKDRIGLEKKELSPVSELDIAIMLYGALLHDVGMAISEEDKERILQNRSVVGKDASSSHYDFQLSGVFNIPGITGEEQAFQEYVRRRHAFQSRVYVERELSETCFPIPGHGLNFKEDVAKLCQSHNETYHWIRKNLSGEKDKGDFTYNLQFCACLLRLGDILDFDSQRTPMKLYMMIAPQGRSDKEWLQHFAIENGKKVIYTERNELQVKFTGSCSDPYIHRKIYNYLDFVKQELVGTCNLMSSFSDRYRLPLSKEVYHDIRGEGYDVPDYKMSVDYRAVSTLLMGEKIYGDKKMGLRELLQNAMDACKIRQEIENKKYKLGDEKYRPVIQVILEEKNKKVRIRDNGTGMTEEILQNHFLSIGHSYYQSDTFKLRDYAYQPIGTFGIGFLSCFMLSKEVTVKTAYFESDTCLELDMEQGEEYFSLKKNPDYRFKGTEVILDYDPFMEVFISMDSICNFIEEYILIEDIEFRVISQERKEERCLKTGFMHKMTVADSSPICIDPYFNGISGYVALKNRPFILRTFGDLSIEKNVFYYDGERIIEDHAFISNLEIAPLVKEDMLTFFYLQNTDPYPEDSSLYDFTVLILYDNNKPSPAGISDIVMKSEGSAIKSILSAFHGDDIQEEERFCFFHTNRFSDYVIPFYHEHKEEQHSVEIDDENYLLPGNHSICYSDVLHYYNKNIRIEDASFSSDDFMAYTGLEIEGVLNLTHKSIEPDVAREYFSSKNSIDLTYTFMRIKHLLALETLPLQKGEKKVLESFISNYYPQLSVFEKIEG